MAEDQDRRVGELRTLRPLVTDDAARARTILTEYGVADAPGGGLWAEERAPGEFWLSGGDDHARPDRRPPAGDPGPVGHTRRVALDAALRATVRPGTAWVWVLAAADPLDSACGVVARGRSRAHALRATLGAQLVQLHFAPDYALPGEAGGVAAEDEVAAADGLLERVDEP